jgi:hypothetical protein
MFPTILSIVGLLVPQILLNRGVIGASTDTLITGLMGPVSQVIAGIKAGTSKTQDGLAALAAASGVIAVLKSTTGLSPDLLSQVDDIDKDVQAALVAYAKAGTGLDLSVYAQIAPVS